MDHEPIRVRLVTGKPSARDEYGVASQRQVCRPWVSHEPNACGAGDSPPLGRADRDRRDFEIGPRFDFDQGDRAAASRNKVDFTSGDDKSLRQDRVALEAQKQGRNGFGPEPIDMGFASALSPLFGLSPHRWAPASASARA